MAIIGYILYYSSMDRLHQNYLKGNRCNYYSNALHVGGDIAVFLKKLLTLIVNLLNIVLTIFDLTMLNPKSLLKAQKYSNVFLHESYWRQDRQNTRTKHF